MEGETGMLQSRNGQPPAPLYDLKNTIVEPAITAGPGWATPPTVPAGKQKMKSTMNKISWRLILELIEAIVEAILRIFGGKSDKNKDQK